jgi:hypothetical protein
MLIRNIFETVPSNLAIRFLSREPLAKKPHISSLLTEELPYLTTKLLAER